VEEQDWLAQRFEAHRSRLRAVAYRMLGSLGEADDAVQETWLRLSRSDTSGIENMGGWLTTVVGRVCLDMLRSRKSCREGHLDEPQATLVSEPIVGRDARADPEHEALLADSIGLALLMVLETLSPAERLAFVLHDTFGVPFKEIAPKVGRSPNAIKMLASRARRRVRSSSATAPEAYLNRQREVIDAFLAASRRGDFEALLAVLDPDVVLRADSAAVQSGAANEVRGAPTVADTFSGRARFARPALIDGAAGAVWARLMDGHVSSLASK
jgi:RNA polymerase sigma factor (sigma-70 family)